MTTDFSGIAVAKAIAVEHVARKLHDRSRSEGFTLVELLVVVAILGVVTAIAVPGLLRARTTSNETAAVGTLRSVNTAQHTYASSCGNGSYAITLPVLKIGPGGSSDGYLSPDLASNVAPVKSGYGFTLAAGMGSAAGLVDCNGTVTMTAYYFTAVPTSLGSTGTRGFATNQGGAI